MQNQYIAPIANWPITLERINTPIAGNEQSFIDKLQVRVNAGVFFGTPEEAELAPDVDTPVSFKDE